MSLFESVNNSTVEQLKVGMRVDWYYKVINVSKKTKRDGGVYLALEFMDKTGKIPGKVWDNAENTYKMLKEGEIYRVAGFVNEFMSKKEIKVDGIRKVPPGEADYKESDFEEIADFDTEVMFEEMMALLKENISNPHLLKLTDLFAKNYKDKFKRHYGAQKVHHAYLGGLLKHTHSMVKFAVLTGKHYELDLDILLTGTLFHDVGKMFEFSISPNVELTAEGGLVGHIVISNRIFLELSGQIQGFPHDLGLKIQHLIVSHHGEKEYGSPEIPKTREAFALHGIDLMDSKLSIVEEAVQNSDSKGLFSDYLHSLGRRILVEDDLEKRE